MPKYLDLLSMNLSQRVSSFWGKHEEAGRIKCAVVEFDIKSGVATSEAFVFDSKVAILGGEGDINLRTEQVNFLLVPKPKRPSLVSLATNLRVTGSIVDPKVRPDTVSLLTKGAKALGALAIGPLGLLVPFANLGANQKHPCDILSTEKLKKTIPADR
jgi:AsmA family protein